MTQKEESAGAVRRARQGLQCPDPTCPAHAHSPELASSLPFSRISGKLGGRELAADSFIHSLKVLTEHPATGAKGQLGSHSLAGTLDNNQKCLCDYGFKRCWAGHRQCVSSGSDTSRAVTAASFWGSWGRELPKSGETIPGRGTDCAKWAWGAELKSPAPQEGSCKVSSGPWTPVARPESGSLPLQLKDSFESRVTQGPVRVSVFL